MIKRFFKQFRFWIEWSYWLRCKHCCIGCKYYDQCNSEVEELDERISADNFFD